MVAAQDALRVLELQVEDLPDLEAQQALERMAWYRTAEPLGLDPYLVQSLDRILKGLRQHQLDALVVHLLRRRRWTHPQPRVGLELAVRETLARKGFAYRVERDGFLYRVGLKVRGEWREVQTPAPWHGLLLLEGRTR